MSGLTLEDVRNMREEALALAEGHKATRVRLFGSLVRGEAGDASDVDFLVDFESGASAIDHVGLVRSLEGLLGRGVEVISAGGLSCELLQRSNQVSIPDQPSPVLVDVDPCECQRLRLSSYAGVGTAMCRGREAEFWPTEIV